MAGKLETESSQEPLTICLWIEHACQERAYSLYKIPLPTDISNYDHLIDSEGFMADSKPIFPVLTIPEFELLEASAFVKLGSKIYLFGGHCYAETDDFYAKILLDDKLIRAVYVLDMSQPHKPRCPVASMRAGKHYPCVFVADGTIYALGTPLQNASELIPGCKGSGCFERYDPNSDQWQVLPDPPLSPSRLPMTTSAGRATVVGREVFIGCDGRYVIYNLDSQEWGDLPPQQLAMRFPYGSLYVEGSLYHLRGGRVYQQGDVWDPGYHCKDIQIVKRGPLTSKDACSLLKSDCLNPQKAQVVANARMLDEDDKFLFTDTKFHPWRGLIHLGDKYFCYVVTAQLVDQDRGTIFDTDSRCIGIKVFKEVQWKNKAKFKSVASFFYKVDNKFGNPCHFGRCCAFGTVPDSWIKMPFKKKLETKSKPMGSEVLQRQRITADCRSQDPEEERDEVAALKKLLAVREEEIVRLHAELARKDELLKITAES